MTEPTYGMEFEDEVRAAMEVPFAREEFVNRLNSRLMQHNADKRRPFRPNRLRAVWVTALSVFGVVVFATLLIGPQRVFAAVRGILGYIPGIGVVQQVPSLRVLSEAVSAEREGITVLVEQGAADDQRTILVYRVDGLSVAAANSQGEGAVTGGIAVLRLPDGSILTQRGAEMIGWGTGYQMRLVFPPLPEDVDTFALMLSRLESMPPGAAPEDWSIPVQFMPAPEDLEMMPVYELTAPQEDSTPEIKADTTATLSPEIVMQDQPSRDIVLSLDQVVELEDGFLLQGKITWGEEYAYVSFPVENGLVLLDSNGAQIPYTFTEPDIAADGSFANTAYWALQTGGKGYPGPWMISASRVEIYQMVQDDEAAIQVDFGVDPQFGQTWKLDQQIEVVGQSLHAVSAQYDQDARSGVPVLRIEFETETSTLGIGLEDPLNQPETENQVVGAGGGGPESAAPGKVTASLAYFARPTGEHLIRVVVVNYTLIGNWQMTWTSPAVADEDKSQVERPCLDLDRWQQIKGQQTSLPEGLDIVLLMEEYTGQLMPQMSLIRADGSQQQVLGIGGWSALSPDGSTVVYIESNGPNLMLMDVASGVVRPVPGSTPDDYHALWSPDGNWLAFVRTNDGIYISQPDGTGLRQVVDNSRIRFLGGWLPDSRTLVLTSLDLEGSVVQRLDIETGALEDLFVVDNRKGGGVLVSPDGERVAFAEMAIGLPSYGIYTANLDGSEKHLAVGLEEGGATLGAWSPDGQWLALMISEPGQAEKTNLALLQPDTCRVLAFPEVSGWIKSWVSPSP